MASPADAAMPFGLAPANEPMPDEREEESAENAGMTEEEIVALCEREINDAVEWSGSKLASDQRRALLDYFGAPYGNERAGRSQVVSRDVFEVVEWIKPALLEIFHASDEIVRFDPVGPEDVKAAEQETALVNHVYSVDNQGFLISMTWITDALLQKLGVVKSWWEVEECIEIETYTGLSDTALLELGQTEDEIEFLASDSRETQLSSGEVVGEHDVKLRRTRRNGRVRIMNVPPEEFGMCREATTLDDARFIFHRVLRTESELIAQGYDPVLIRDLPSGTSESWRRSQDATVRRSQEGTTSLLSDDRSDASRNIWVTECYARVDYDGDGYAEMRKVTLAGDSSRVLLDVEEVDDHPFSVMTPFPIPHRVYGLSIADVVRDIQERNTSIERNFHDALNFKTNPRHKVLHHGLQGAPMADLDELLSAEPGGYVSEFAPNAISPLIMEDATGPALQGMEMMRTLRENRVGVSRYSAGLDADTLNKTASGINMIQNAAEQRKGLIARIFAQCGYRHLFRRISKLLRMHQDRPRTIRMRGEFVEVDPTAWRHEVDATISVGIGHGNRDSIIMGLQSILSLQAQMTATAPGLLVHPKHAHAAASMLAQKLGFADGGERFFQDPQAPDAVPPPPPPPDPKLIEVQADHQVAMAKVALEAEKLRLEAHKMGVSSALDFGRLGLDAAKALASVEQGKEPD